jgi:RAD54-like protein 2
MSDSSTTEQSPQDTASDPLECKDDEQPDEGLKRKLDDEESPDEIPEKKLKSEHEDDDKKEEDSGNPIINDEETAETHLDGDEIENKHETEQKDDEINSEKKDSESKDKKKVQNLRKNIKDVIDDSQLDATTLAAQRQESERLARLQEQQKLIREAQRQAACEKQQQKVLSLLKVEDDDEQIPENGENSIDPFLEKFSIKPNVDIKEAAKATLESIQSIITSDQNEESEDDDCVLQQTDPLLTTEKPKTVVVDSSSSDSDDCIILSDEEVDEDEDEDVANSGEHTNDTYNTRDAQGRVVVNIGHNESEPDIFVAPQIARIIKPHQIGGVRFLYDNIIESTELFDKSTGFGCILAQ